MSPAEILNNHTGQTIWISISYSAKNLLNNIVRKSAKNKYLKRPGFYAKVASLRVLYWIKNAPAEIWNNHTGQTIFISISYSAKNL